MQADRAWRDGAGTGLFGMKLVNWRPLAICAAIGAVIFCLCFRIEVLNPLNVHWLLQGDWGASFIGWEAYRHDGWRLPLGAERLLDWPAGDNIVFTDSLPALAFLFKILSPILPDPFQYIGWWFFISLILQVYFGHRLARKAGMDELESFISGFLIGLTPFFLARLYHNTLFSHWMILWALEIYGFEKIPQKRTFGFGLLLVLTSLTNFYLTFMVAGVFAADVLRTRLRRMRSGPAVGAVAGAESKAVASLIIAMGLVGYFGARQSAAGGFGVYVSELLAWINPQIPLNSRFVPAIPVTEGAYEGFQYLGLGVIGLVLLGLGLRLKRVIDKAPTSTEATGAEATGFDGAAYLAPVIFAFWVFALSDKIHLGPHVLIDLHYGSLLGPITAMLRSSGRFMWPVSYALILATLLAVAKMPRQWVKRALIAALVLQIADLSAFMRQQWKYTEAAAAPAVFHRLRSPQWDRLIASAKVVDFQPSDPQPRLDLFWELAFRATRHGVPLTDMYSARVAPAQYLFQKADDEDVRLGRLAPDRLYVLADDCAPFPVTSVRRLDGVMIIPPSGADLSGLGSEPVRPPVVSLGAPIAFARPESRCVLGAGWLEPQADGVSSDGSEAALYLPLPEGATGPLRLSVQISGLSGGAFDMEATSQRDVLIARRAQAPDTVSFEIPAKLVSGSRALSITLRSTLKAQGAGKAPNGPVFHMATARLEQLSGAQ